MSLFSSFQLNLMFFLIIFSNFLILSSVYFFNTKIFNLMLNFLFENFKTYLSFKSSKGENSFFLNVFVFIFVLNFLGLMPFVFPFTSQISLTFFLSLSMFISILFWGSSQSFKTILAHLLPKGSPLFLMPFLILIETTSWFIRPFTLSIRLTANILAGHILISLASSLEYYSSLILLILFFLEVFVSFIQAFVFSLLLLNYKLDVM